MEKKMFYLKLYNSFILTLIFALLVIFYQKLSVPINTLSSLTENLGNTRTANTNEASLTNRDEVISDLTNLASLAQMYYRKPIALGGGYNSFNGWSIPVQLITTGNGRYTEVVANQSVTLVGTGNEIGKDGSSPVKVTMVIGNDRIISTIVNN